MPDIQEQTEQADERQRWRAGLSDELAFWQSALRGETEYLRSRLTQMLSPEGRRAKFPVRLLAHLRQFAEQTGRPALILDAGAGPFSTLAWASEQRLAEVVAVDPLAEAYAQMLAEYGYEYPVIARTGSGEQLCDLFPEAHFDVVYSRNALDECVSPHEMLRQLVRVLRGGGLLFLEGTVAEGTRQGWVGLHQHDLVPVEDDFLHRGPNIAASSLIRGLPLRRIFGGTGEDGAVVATSWRDSDWYVLIYEKCCDSAGPGAEVALARTGKA
ncbi:class I SAM-dependent methyltransferase [Natronosporangium hydrolyticum]|uniref:Class I SAM-dependent methyltransferase n=1 Tax=Natronosporangium hydrolyticum TaxID=2811111 RepID=A0A895YH29_9ACTN|nr:methyltransferase domain-containing protein [Natronosporangium hydrolyticum]QSB16861.1 class I SAM-dependent methyltransferase [Natronosporangium hydrolyticum]